MKTLSFLLLFTVVLGDVTKWCSINSDCLPGGSTCTNGVCSCNTEGYITLATTGICLQISTLPKINATVEIVFDSTEPCTIVNGISTLKSDLTEVLKSETDATAVERIEVECTGTEVWIGAYIHNSRAYSAGPTLSSFTTKITGKAFHTILKDPKSVTTRTGTSSCVITPITRAFKVRETCHTMACGATHNLINATCVEVPIVQSDDGLSGGDICVIIIGVIGGLTLIMAIIACCSGSGERLPDGDDEDFPKDAESSAGSDH